MVFSSISFLYYFLPIVLITFMLVPKNMKNIVLLISSLFFYFYGEPVYILLMIFAAFSGYIHGLIIDKFKGSHYSRVAMISSIITSLGMLAYFKYSNFFITNVNSLFRLNIDLLDLALPIGISFYTFQIMSYTIEVYRGNAKVQKSFMKFTIYASFFPQLIAGPIVRYTTVADSLDHGMLSFEGFAYGVRRFIIGLSKKVLIANILGELCVAFKISGDKSILFYWVYAAAFGLHVYFDFSGYSDMAIGLGKLFGFHFLENFNYPYISKSIAEFWRRWHISMGTWFRDYLYIPMGGNRVTKSRWLLNIFVVWFMTGFWHGADWNFIVWGLFYAVLAILEKYFFCDLLKKLPVVFSHFYVIFFVLISFIIFNADGMADAISSIVGMFGFLDLPAFNFEAMYYLRSYAVPLVVAVIGTTPLAKMVIGKIKGARAGDMIVNAAEPVLLIALLLTVTAYLVDGSFNPFLYFRF